MFEIYALALIDSLSIGTLIIPLILLLQRQVNWTAIAVYCATLGIFYFTLGMFLLLGVGVLEHSFFQAIDSTVGLWIQLILGSMLLLWALFYDVAFVRTLFGRPKVQPQSSTNVWEKRILNNTGLVGIVSIAILAGVLEAATMAPYLAAIAILGTSPIEISLQAITLLGYCVVMFMPAIALVTFRRFGGKKMDSKLDKFKNWMAKQVSSATPWILGLIGFFLVRYAASILFNS